MPAYHRVLSIPLFDHTGISLFNQIPQCKIVRRPLEKLVLIPFQIFLRLAEWVSEHQLCQGAQERGFSMRSTRCFGGMEKPEPRWRSCLKSVLLLSRNIQERKRIKHSYRLTGLIAQLSLSPSTVQAKLQKPDLRVLSESFPFLVRDTSHLSGK